MTDDATPRALDEIIGHTFRTPSLAVAALTHASVAESRLDSNERLEFLGDAVLGLVVSGRIFELFPSLQEGDMTKIKSTVVSRQTCAEIAFEIGLHEALALGKGMQNQSQLPVSLAAAVLEAVIAALYLDAGFETAAAFIRRHFEPYITRAARSGHQENFKSVLQQHAQQEGLGSVSYRILDEKGPDHAKCFKVAAELNGRRFEPTWGQSKKRAEQQAALNALMELGIVRDEADGQLRVVDGSTTAS